MSNQFQFDPMVPLIWLTPIVILIAVLGWQEARKPYRFRWLRVIAQTFALLALGAIILRPSYTTTEPKPGLVLLTPNYAVKTLDSVVAKHPGIQVILAPGADVRDGGVAIESFHELQHLGDVQFVLGDGVPLASLGILEEDPFVYIQGTKPNGIVSLVTGPFQENRKQWLLGEVRNAKNTRLTLLGPGGVEDSLHLKISGLDRFQLGFTTKRPGNYVYTLRVVDGNGLAVEEQVPVEVAGSRKLRILMLQMYPQAEVRFLKNYLTEKNHVITVRYQVSKNVFRYEFANGSTGKIGVLSTRSLGDYDLLITDDESLDRLTASERFALEQAVNQGLCLLILLQRPPETKRFPGNALNLIGETNAPDTVRYNVDGFGSFVSPLVAVNVSAKSSAQSVTMSGTRMLAGFVLKGEGKVGFQSLRETYRLALGGDSGPYAALWTPLLEQMARREDVSIAAKTTIPFPLYPDEPVNIELIGSGPLKVSTGSGARIPLTEDVLVDDVWHGTYAADAPGWLSMNAGESYTFSSFISKPGAWPSLRRANQQRGNILVSAEGQPSKAETKLVAKAVTPLIFFLIFLLSAGFVWLAPKV